MTFAYYPSFDLSRIQAGTLEMGTPTKPSIQLSLSSFTVANDYFTFTPIVNHLVTSEFLGPDRLRSPLLAHMCAADFGTMLGIRLSELADDAGWTDPENISVLYNGNDQVYEFSYSHGINQLSWSSARGRRLFGFATDYSGANVETVIGTQLPLYVLNATLENPSSMTPVLEADPIATIAHSAEGRAYAMGRTGTVMRRSWVQQYEPKVKTWRRFAPAAPNEYTFQQLYEECRAGLVFGAGDYENEYLYAYTFDEDQDAFHPQPATPGNSDQFHIPFNTIVLGVDF